MINPETPAGDGSPQERWIRLGLAAEFPYIAPDSSVFDMALELYEEAEVANQHQDYMYVEQISGWREAAADFAFLHKKIELFKMVSHGIHHHLRSLNRQQRNGADYTAAIQQSCEHPHIVISTISHFSEDQKDELRKFVNNLAFEYWGDDRHFTR